MKKIIYIFSILFLILGSFNFIYANEVLKTISNTFSIDSYLESFEEHIKYEKVVGFDVQEIYNDLIQGNAINYSNLLDVFIKNLSSEIKNTTKDAVSIFVILIIVAIISSVELDDNSDVIKITKLVIYIALTSLLLKNYLEIVAMFKDIINILSYIMQLVSTFLMGVLVATGKITTTGIIQPLLLLISNVICFVCEYIVIPFFTVSIAINVISKISDNIKLDNISILFRKSSLYVFSSVIGIFLLILSMESSVTSEIDSLYLKTTQNIVSNVVPVVGKFFSDSIETVMGATKIIGRVGGIVAIISTIVIVSVPVLKLLIVVVIYNILIAISEPINEDKNIEGFIKCFVNVYKDMLGIIIGIMLLFVISTGIILNIIGSVAT